MDWNWNDKNSINRLEVCIIQYFSTKHQDKSKAKLCKYVWLMRDVFLDPVYCTDIVCSILHCASIWDYITDEYMELMFRYYLGKMMYDLYIQNFFFHDNNFRKRYIFNLKSVDTCKHIIEKVMMRDISILQGMTSEIEGAFFRSLSNNDLFNRLAVEPRIQLYNKANDKMIRTLVLDKMVKYNGIPPNIPDEIASFGLTSINLLQQAINPEYVTKFINTLFKTLKEVK